MEDCYKSTPGFYEEVSSKVLEASNNILELLILLRIAVDILLPLRFRMMLTSFPIPHFFRASLNPEYGMI